MMQGLRSGLVLLVACGVWGTVSLAQQPPPPAPAAPPAAAPAAPVPAAPAPAAAPAAPAPVAPPPAAVVSAPPQSPPENPDEKLITMNFQDIDLDALVKFISEITGRNFILDDRVKGKVTIISPGKISVDEAYAVFQSVLQVKGFTTVPSGAVLKILPSQEAKSSTVKTVFPGRPFAEGDEFVTQLIPLKNVDVNNMLGIIQPLVSANGLLAAYTATNTMIIIDSASNIDRIVRILRELDIPDKERGIDVVRLNYAFATEIAATLAQVLEEPSGGASQIAGGAAAARRPARASGAGRASRCAPAGATGLPAAAAQPVEGGTGASSYKIIPDERTNALIVVAGPLQMRKIKDLIVRLDVPLPFGTGRIHVYYLKYANAFEIVPVLSDLIGGGGVGGLSARAPRPRPHRHDRIPRRPARRSAAASAAWGSAWAAALNSADRRRVRRRLRRRRTGRLAVGGGFGAAGRRRHRGGGGLRRLGAAAGWRRRGRRGVGARAAVRASSRDWCASPPIPRPTR